MHGATGMKSEKPKKRKVHSHNKVR